MEYVGVDGCPDGWVAVAYEDEAFAEGGFFESFEGVWEAYSGAESVLVDIPIGLREGDGSPRACDTAAREYLGSPRGRSVFPPPVRETLDAESYEAAKAIQEAATAGSLGRQAWAIAGKIREVDDFLRANPERVGVVREAHPEVCFAALAGGEAMAFSKTGRPAAAFWERVDALETVDADALRDVQEIGESLDCAASNDDVLDAFALALTASPRTPETATLPSESDTDPSVEPGHSDTDPSVEPDHIERDPRGLPMEMVYAPDA